MIPIVLNRLIETTKEKTMAGVIKEMEQNIAYLLEHINGHNFMDGKTILTLKAVMQIYQRILSKYMSTSKSTEVKTILVNLVVIGNKMLKMMKESKYKLAANSSQILKHGDRIMILGRSKAVEGTLISAFESGTRFSLTILETRPNCDGYSSLKVFSDKGIPCKLVADSSIAYYLETECDYVIVGAETVVENGGIINRVGTYTLALCANALKKPVYCIAEHFKFYRSFPLRQKDLPVEAIQTDDMKLNPVTGQNVIKIEDRNLYEKMITPLCDFTPPN